MYRYSLECHAFYKRLKKFRLFFYIYLQLCILQSLVILSWASGQSLRRYITFTSFFKTSQIRPHYRCIYCQLILLDRHPHHCKFQLNTQFIGIIFAKLSYHIFSMTSFIAPWYQSDRFHRTAAYMQCAHTIVQKGMSGTTLSWRIIYNMNISPYFASKEKEILQYW